ncbi:hypothetical protein [Sulfuriflexus mobilis]|uniref:hypothetical protein n=1 Tax=Sulfuriflexus mobilis TaxID=1811807 RepID=UPI000F8483AF|nr:hypothetical protein [Sulfuriflexus mobilis]
MYDRLDDIPVYARRPTKVSATHYNHVKLALKRLGDEIRLVIPRLKHLDLILQDNAWIIVDRVLNDVPIAAWTDFQIDNRDNLHEDIHCQLKLYHMNAELILDRSLDAMEMLLSEELPEMLPDDVSDVIPFKQQDD